MKLPFKVELTNQVTVVTGASGVLCSEMAKALALCGAKVVVAGRNSEKNLKIVEEIQALGGIAISSVFDVLDKDQMEIARDNIIQKWGKIDLLINGAGGNSPLTTTTMEHYTPDLSLDKKTNNITFFDLSFENMHKIMDLNLFGTILPCQVFGEVMVQSQKGNIINISSMSALIPLTKIPMYSASKAAVSNFTQWLATYLAPVGIRVNAIAPGFFETNQNHHLLHNQDGTYSPRAKKIILGTPMSKFGIPKDLIGSILYLASDEASGFVSGINIPIDGGFSAYSGV